MQDCLKCMNHIQISYGFYAAFLFEPSSWKWVVFQHGDIILFPNTSTLNQQLF